MNLCMLIKQVIIYAEKSPHFNLHFTWHLHQTVSQYISPFFRRFNCSAEWYVWFVCRAKKSAIRVFNEKKCRNINKKNEPKNWKKRKKRSKQEQWFERNISEAFDT